MKDEERKLLAVTGGLLVNFSLVVEYWRSALLSSKDNYVISRKKKGVGVGRKGITCSQSQTFYRTPFTHERGAIVQFDWLVARQAKRDSRNLSFMHNPTSGAQDENIFGQVRTSVRIFCSRNGKHIHPSRSKTKTYGLAREKEETWLFSSQCNFNIPQHILLHCQPPPRSFGETFLEKLNFSSFRILVRLIEYITLKKFSADRHTRQY